MQLDLKWITVKPTWPATIILVACVYVFLKLGFWQLKKGEDKQAIAVTYQASAGNPPIDLNIISSDTAQLKQLHSHKVSIRGHYNPSYQILLDNQVHQQQAGFHVLTPFMLDGSELAILVNRGWVAGFSDHQKTPVIQTNQHQQEITGMLWMPSDKIFSFESASAWALPGVWQQLDYKVYQHKTPLRLLPVILKLDASIVSDGFVRDWQLPPDKVASHFSYAYQWFGFVIAAVMIYLYNISTIKRKQHTA